jgi:hypothetical protein
MLKVLAGCPSASSGEGVHAGLVSAKFVPEKRALLLSRELAATQHSSWAGSLLLCGAYQNFGGPLVATKVTARTGGSIFDSPDAVKALLK